MHAWTIGFISARGGNFDNSIDKQFIASLLCCTILTVHMLSNIIIKIPTTTTNPAYILSMRGGAAAGGLLILWGNWLRSPNVQVLLRLYISQFNSSIYYCAVHRRWTEVGILGSGGSFGPFDYQWNKWKISFWKNILSDQFVIFDILVLQEVKYHSFS